MEAYQVSWIIVLGIVVVLGVLVVRWEVWPPAEIGRYQLITGEYKRDIFDEAGEFHVDMGHGLFKIDTATGEVWEYSEHADMRGGDIRPVRKRWELCQ